MFLEVLIVPRAAAGWELIRQCRCAAAAHSHVSLDVRTLGNYSLSRSAPQWSNLIDVTLGIESHVR